MIAHAWDKNGNPGLGRIDMQVVKLPPWWWDTCLVGGILPRRVQIVADESILSLDFSIAYSGTGTALESSVIRDYVPAHVPELPQF